MAGSSASSGAGRALLAGAGLLLAAAAVAAAADGHNRAFSKRFFHAPAADDDCTVCHSLHGSRGPKDLVAPVPELCYQCHADVAAKDVVHEPVGAGRCTDCHEVHTADVRPLLVRKVPELCLECHPVDAPHRARGNVCTGCHGVHSSETALFLQGPESSKCSQCHGDKREGERVHQPAREGKCLSCHFTHRDPRFKAQRFREPFAAGTATPDRKGARTFALCDRCHAAALHTDPAYRETGFRTAGTNLHVRHLVGPKAVSCSVCHDLHSARRAALMAEWVRPPGKEAKPMQFLRFDAGGSCGPSCHAAATYLREDRSELSEEEP